MSAEPRFAAYGLDKTRLKSTKNVNPLLKRERERATFDSRKMTYLLDGSEDATNLKETIAALVVSDEFRSKLFNNVKVDPESPFADDKAFNYRGDYFLSREDFITRTWENRAFIIKKIQELGLDEKEAELLIYYTEVHSGFHSTQESMFIPTLKNQTSPEQKAKWYELAKNFAIIGNYGQTELGHGSNVRGLETTATYDKKTKEFIIHSPTLTSTKWWPGGLGKLSNHVLVYARLIIDGKDYGIHGFIAQIRSLEDHTPLPGVSVGDIGPKFGFNGVDNGYLRFDNYRIPRENMLMRYSSVSEDGVYTKPPHAKIGYGTMVYVRSTIVYGASDNLARACTIAIRYSAIRQQFPRRGESGGEEIPVLDYQTQQYRLFPLLAQAYAFHFTGNWMMELYEQMQEQLQKGDLSLMPLAHATTAGLKAITTWETSAGIEECRKCCGGHGYSQLSGLPELFVNYVPSCTFEGENFILLLQTAQYILKQFHAKKFLIEFAEFEGKKLNISSSSDHTKIFALRALKMASKAAELLEINTAKTQNEHEAFNNTSVDLVKMAKAFCYYIIVRNFATALEKVTDPTLKAVLATQEELFSLYHIELEMGDFLELGLIDKADAQAIHTRVLELLKSIRPNAVALVDSFNFPDFLLNSALGRYDGNAYEHMYYVAKSNGLNRLENDALIRAKFIQSVKPFQKFSSKL